MRSDRKLLEHDDGWVMRQAIMVRRLVGFANSAYFGVARKVGVVAPGALV
jgi:hypothetical protein